MKQDWDRQSQNIRWLSRLWITWALWITPVSASANSSARIRWCCFIKNKNSHLQAEWALCGWADSTLPPTCLGLCKDSSESRMWTRGWNMPRGPAGVWSQPASNCDSLRLRRVVCEYFLQCWSNKAGCHPGITGVWLLSASAKGPSTPPRQGAFAQLESSMPSFDCSYRLSASIFPLCHFKDITSTYWCDGHVLYAGGFACVWNVQDQKKATWCFICP